MNPSFNKQRGAVLAFSLIMLVLLTLVSVNMISQNKTQLGITSNTREQAVTFAEVEAELGRAQTVIENTRYDPDPSIPEADRPKCKDTDQLYAGDPLPSTDPNSQDVLAEVLAVACRYEVEDNVYDEFKCEGNTYTPELDGEDVRSQYNKIACDKLTAAQCPTELYTMRVSVTDPNTHAKRMIKSKFAVGCKVDG